MTWNPNARDPWPAARYLNERSSWPLVAIALIAVLLAIAGLAYV